jgi:hypothetical protein
MPDLSRFINRSENPHDIDTILCGSTALTSIENAIYEVIEIILKRVLLVWHTPRKAKNLSMEKM